MIIVGMEEGGGFLAGVEALAIGREFLRGDHRFILTGEKSDLKKIETISDFKNKIICGDSLKSLQKIPSDSVDLIITSPPYFQQRDYGGFENEIGGEKEVQLYIDNLLKVFSECLRIIKKSGNIVFNIGDKYTESNLLLIPFRFAIEATKKYSVKLVNEITWVKLNPTPRQYRKRLVSSTEPFFHFVKDNNYYFDLEEYLNFQKLTKLKKNGNGNRIGKKYFELIDKSDLTKEEKKLAMKELQETIEEVKSGKIESFRMKIRGLHSLPFGGQQGGRKTQILNKGFTMIKIHGNNIKRDLIESPVETIKGIQHPAVYPEYIIKELIKLLTPKGGIVLDPFMGSGTTAIASKKLGRDYIGFEINKKYCDYANERLKRIDADTNLEEFII